MNLLEITEQGIESIFEEVGKYLSKGEDDPIPREIANYKINALAAYTISQQVLALIRADAMGFAQMGFNHLRGKLAEIKEGFSKQPYVPITEELEKMLIGPNSPIMQEVTRRGGLT